MRLGVWLEQHGRSQSQFARELGVSRNYMHTIVRGKTICGRSLADVIAGATNGEVRPVDLGLDDIESRNVYRRRVSKNVIVL